MKLRVATLLVCAAGWAVRVFASCPTQPPQLVAPANGAANVGSPVHFDWNSVSGADAYRLWASFGGANANIIALTTDSEYTTNVPAGSVEWWVDAVGDRTCTAPVTAGCPSNLASPSLLAPANAATGLASPVLLSWTAVSGISGYRVFASLNGSPAVGVGTTTSTQLSVPFPQGNVTWFVEAQFVDCPSTFSRFGTFTIAVGAPCSSTPATLVAPANGATITTSPVTFQWNRVASAAGYKLYIGGDLGGTTTDTTLTRLVGEGLITWRVDTMFPGCPDVPSAQFTFTVPAANSCTGTIALLTPAENASVSSPVLLGWTPIAAATAYRIWISVDDGAPVAIARSINNSQALPLPSGNIDWYVEALFASCPSILCERRRVLRIKRRSSLRLSTGPNRQVR